MWLGALNLEELKGKVQLLVSIVLIRKEDAYYLVMCSPVHEAKMERIRQRVGVLMPNM